MLEPLPSSFASTRNALHALAEHVLAAARYHADGRIGLVPTPGGFGTPFYGEGERLRVDGVELVHDRPHTSTRVVITTLADAATFAGVPLGAPADVYTPATACDPATPLHLDVAAVHAIAAWYDLGRNTLDDLCAMYAAHAPTERTIWPEHFDLACELGDAAAGTRANFGASPGDDAIAEPYLYVGPWDAARRTGAFAAHPWGAAITYGALCEEGEPRAGADQFFREHSALLLGEP